MKLIKKASRTWGGNRILVRRAPDDDRGRSEELLGETTKGGEKVILQGKVRAVRTPKKKRIPRI